MRRRDADGSRDGAVSACNPCSTLRRCPQPESVQRGAAKPPIRLRRTAMHNFWFTRTAQHRALIANRVLVDYVAVPHHAQRAITMSDV